MTRSGAYLVYGISALVFCGPLTAQSVSVPSGTEMRLFEVIFDEQPEVARFRFVTAAISPANEALQFEDVIGDLEYLCADVVLPALSESDRQTDAIVISLSEREIAFGEVAPDVVQFFQPFRISENACIWEEF